MLEPDDNGNGVGELINSPKHYLLGMSPYNSLIEQKNDIQKQYSALASIVSTTNMNPKVLMKQSLLERRKILLRIDASTTGEAFLQQMVVENKDETTVFADRLALGKLLQQKRKDINTRFYLHQVEVYPMSVSDFHYLFLCLKQIKSEHKTSRLSFYSFHPETQKDYNEKLVLACLLDEFKELRATITEEMKQNAQK